MYATEEEELNWDESVILTRNITSWLLGLPQAVNGRAWAEVAKEGQ